MESNLFGMAWAQLWQVTQLVGVVVIVVRVVARNRPHLAYALWLVVLVKCVTPPVFASPSGVFCWLLPPRQVVVVESTVMPEPVRLATPPEELIIPLYPVESVPTPTAAPAPVVKVPRGRLTWSDWAAYGLLVWAVGASVSLGLSVWRWRACFRKARRVPCEPDLGLAERVSGLARRLGLRRRVRVLVTRGRLGPAVTGVLRPTLLMPEGMLADKTVSELEPLLAHELIHIRRGDLWAGLLQTVVLALWWFHPLVRWAVRESMREAERCCDEAVLAELACKPRDYARSLLGVLQYKMEWAPAPAFPGAGRIDATSKRLERIMRLGQGCRRRSPWWCWLVTAAAAAVVLPGGAFVVSGEESAPPPPLSNVADGMRSGGNGESSSDPKEAEPARTSASEPTVAANRWHEVLRSYELGELIESVRQDYATDAVTAREFISADVNALIRAATREGGATAWPVHWSGNRLLVRASAQAQAALSDALEVMRVYGMAQLTLSVRFVSGPSEAIDSLALAWNVMPNEQGDESNPLGLVPPWDPASGILNMDRAFPDQEASTSRGSVRHVTHTPMRYAMLDEEEATSLIEQIQQHRRCNVSQSPKVRLFNGQTGTVSDVSQSPFVVSVKPVRGDRAIAHQPVISVVEEGTRLRLRPVLRENGAVRLDYKIVMTAIHKVDTFKFSVTGNEEPATVQLPVVETMQVDGTNELAVGSTLVVAGLVKPDREPERVVNNDSMLTRLANSLFGDNVKRQADAPNEMSLMLLLRVDRVIPTVSKQAADESHIGMVSP